MAPVCLAGRLTLAIFVFVLFLASVTRTINSLLVYDRQELLKIKTSVNVLASYGRGEQKQFLPPLFADVPAYLFRAGAQLPRRRRRRGTRSGWLVRIKAWLASSPKVARFPWSLSPEYGACLRRFVSRRALVPVGTWLVPVVGPYEELHAVRPRLSGLRCPGRVNQRNLKPLSRTAHAADIPAVFPASTRCAVVNARSVMNKTFILQDFFTSHALDVLFLTETWINVGESAAFTELLPPDCTFINSPRTSGRGGGIVTVLKHSLYYKPLPLTSFSSFELSLFELGRSDPVLCAVIYRTPKYNRDFIKDLSDFLACVMTDYDRTLCVGDFNVHVCCPSKPLAKDFLDLIDAFNLVQHVTGPTQEHGHMLDAVLSHNLTILNVQVCDAVFSDHMPVLFDFNLPCHSFKPAAPVRHCAC